MVMFGLTAAASITRISGLAFVAVLIVFALWWGAYLELLRRLGGISWAEGLAHSRWILALLCFSLLPDAGALLSGRLPAFNLAFDASTQSLYRWLAGCLLGVAAIWQELVLLRAATGIGRKGTSAVAVREVRSMGRFMASLPNRGLTALQHHPLRVAVVVALLVAGGFLRWMDRTAAHPGDMNVLLSITYNLLEWPPFAYYHNYRPQPWVYNHLPLFPMLLAPLYWLLENVMHLPTMLGVKLLTLIADLAVGLLILGQAGKRRWGWVWGAVLAGAWMLAPWVVAADDHPIAPAVALAVAALCSLERPWLAGLLLGLGVATRNEVAFFAIPLAVHFGRRRGLAPTVAFLATLGTVVALVGGPFVLTDPEAMDYAMRRQLQRDAENQISLLASLLMPYLSAGVATFLRENPALLALGLNLPIALLPTRDRRPARVMLVAAVGYLLTLPLLHDRYTLFVYALGLFYAVRYRSPLVAVLSLGISWPGFSYGQYAQIALFFVMIVESLRHWGDRRGDKETAIDETNRT